MDPNLSSLLKWSVENTSSATPPTDTDSTSTPSRPINPDALNALFGGPSDADLLKMSMSAILSTDPSITLSDKLIAFDNFEQLIENLDNANNLEPLSLWTPLLSCLKHEESEIRKMAAWCVGTAVQNNEKSQERLLAMNGIPALVELARGEDQEESVRRKAVYALSSASRNYQPAMDVLTGELGGEKVDAADMDAVDVLIGGLREAAKKGGKA
ncbi:nucleotide exchange factor Fes1-domain-containing protein [Leptodontidium sp. 2 PMI_412]|nr:nucleotide exchange factor Fes1-domain-containing protein [Leptodontidium sp. MPI-SDFR-AT-0119]KAH9221117.1 nucleotide exchange factor Fes1-domain-containing protein [Leptodontidium sp. 2 PMI_412]